MIDITDDLYFKTIVDYVCDPVDPSNPLYTYDLLFEILIKEPFTILESMPMDENRVADALYFRENICENSHPWYLTFSDTPSVLEVIYALADRMDGIFGEEDDSRSRFFWMMLRNLGLDIYNDEYIMEHPRAEHTIRRICYNLCKRQYDYLGVGSLFPATKFREAAVEANYDARTTEIWYQMQFYMSHIE